MYSDTVNGLVDRHPLELPEPIGPIVHLQEKLFVPVKEYPDVSSCFIHCIYCKLCSPHIVTWECNVLLSCFSFFLFCILGCLHAYYVRGRRASWKVNIKVKKLEFGFNTDSTLVGAVARMAFLKWKEMHVYMHTQSRERIAHGVAITLIVELRKMVTALKGQVSKCLVYRMTDVFIFASTMCRALQSVDHSLPPLWQSFAHTWMVVTSWRATFLFVIPAGCSEEINRGRCRRIRTPQSRTRPSQAWIAFSPWHNW